jgi:hypothetical protein
VALVALQLLLLNVTNEQQGVETFFRPLVSQRGKITTPSLIDGRPESVSVMAESLFFGDQQTGPEGVRSGVKARTLEPPGLGNYTRRARTLRRPFPFSRRLCSGLSFRRAPLTCGALCCSNPSSTCQEEQQV